VHAREPHALVHAAHGCRGRTRHRAHQPPGPRPRLRSSVAASPAVVVSIMIMTRKHARTQAQCTEKCSRPQLVTD
jgi:hypothetical protein